MKVLIHTGTFYLLLLLTSLTATAQEITGDSQKPRLFIECSFSRLCNLDYIRKEITIVDFVRDRFQADIHIIVTTQPTGGGGSAHTLTFNGQGNYAAKKDTLVFYTISNATEDDQRQQLIRYVKIGLLPYLIHTQAVSLVDVNYKNAQTADAAVPAKDKWKSWVFSLEGRLNLNGDQNYKEHTYGVGVSASKVTDSYKTSFGFTQNQSRNKYSFGEDSKEVLNTLNEYRTIYHDYVKSLSPKWSLGYETRYTHSSYDNLDHALTLSPGIEYNIYPYKISSSKFLAIRYRLNADKRNYMEETLFDKKQEWLFSNDIGLYASYTQKWGSVNGSLTWYNYLDDFSKNNLSLYLNLQVQVIKGLSVNLYTSASIINDQLNIAKEGADSQEVLLRLKALSTNFNYYTSIGFSYRFGSAFNNIVNPRFTNGRMD